MILSPLIVTSLLTATPTSDDPPQPNPAAPTAHLSILDLFQTDSHAVHTDQPYFRVSSGFAGSWNSDGPANQDVDFDNAPLISLGLGKRVRTFERGFDLGAEFDGVFAKLDAHTQGPVDAVNDVGVAAFLFDGLLNYHFEFEPRFSLYGGFGLGVAMLDVSTGSDAAHDFDAENGPFVAWQAKTGAIWRFAPHVAVHAGLRFLRVEDAHIEDKIGNSDFDLRTRLNALEAGLMFDI